MVNGFVPQFSFRLFVKFWILTATSLLVAGLRDVRVTVPDAVRSGDGAELLCHYDLEGDALYSVKWYKGRREFYRFTPREDPPMKIFPIPGLEIKIKKSNATHLFLDQVAPGLSGRYSCEVSADAPSFHTALVSADMDVVVTPRHRPILQGIKHRYRAGDVLKVNCTSSGSRPAANLTWFFNGEQVHPRHIKVYRTMTAPESKLASTMSILELPLTSRMQGRLKVRCIASIHSLYWQTTEKSAEVGRVRESNNDVIVRSNHEMADEYRPEVEDEAPFVVKAAPSTPQLNIAHPPPTLNILLLYVCIWTIY